MVDDGSTDGTAQALAPVKGRIKYYYQENRGVGAARNRGVAEARSPWVAFLDSDDEWCPGKIETHARCLQDHPGLVVHMTNALYVWPDGRQVDYFKAHRFSVAGSVALSRPFETIAQRYFDLLIPCAVRRETFLQAGGFNERLRIVEDKDLLLRLALRGGFGFSDVVQARSYRSNDDPASLTVQARQARQTVWESVLEVYQGLLKSEPLTAGQRRLVLHEVSHLYLERSLQGYTRGDLMQFRQDLRACWRCGAGLKSAVKCVLAFACPRWAAARCERNRMKNGLAYGCTDNRPQLANCGV